MMFIRFGFVLLFLMIFEKTGSEISHLDCGRSTLESDPDTAEVLTEKGYATQGQWPWLAAIKKRGRDNNEYPQCTAFLIDRRHLISTAHCVDPNDIERYTAHIGDINEEKGDEYRISRFVVHSGYTPRMFYNDIAILTLDREVDNENVNPICLPDEEVSKMNLIDRRTAAAGWGWPARSDGARFDLYQKYRTGLSVISNQQCENAYQDGYNFRRTFPWGVNKDLLCTAFEEDDSDTCLTSGAPLMINNGNRWYAVGITAFGAVCGRDPAIPEGYINVTNYLGWIRENTST